jgi:hypothetical protein
MAGVDGKKEVIAGQLGARQGQKIAVLAKQARASHSEHN